MKITIEHDGIEASMEGDYIIFDDVMQFLVEPCIAAVFSEKMVEEYFECVSP